MSNEDTNPQPKDDLEQLMSADEQAAAWGAGILGHFWIQWTELQSIIAQLKEYPELVTPEHVMSVKNAIRGLMEWLRANGIDAHFEVTGANNLVDVRPGDRL